MKKISLTLLCILAAAICLHAQNTGEPVVSYKAKAPRSTPLVERGVAAPKGLSNRHIALWQSHGMYYSHKMDKWLWQRPCLFQTIEDIFTQSVIVPLLTPMLENAGATVLMPRERDWHSTEIIIDNDPCESTSGRIHGEVSASAGWKTIKGGFADSRAVFEDDGSPFGDGTALRCQCSAKGTESVCWSAEIPARDEYAVYVSYLSTPSSTTSAVYTVHTAGCDKTVRVNQKMASGTWVYLGTFELEKGSHKIVSLSNKGSGGTTVVADAVRVGGGMGNIARIGTDSTSYKVSGMPRFAEGARYNLQWQGFPTTVWNLNDQIDDYRDDLQCRGKWVKYLCSGSSLAPGKVGMGIPVDLSLALHSDAGMRDDKTIVGTLAIYTTRCEEGMRFLGGGSRRASGEYANFVQTQVVNDIQSQWNPEWQRRDLRDASYSESRTTGVPALLLEMFSHENFEDMKYGQDPAFRFTLARAIYKGTLKYLSGRYGRPYIVQPLPVRAFSARIDEVGASAELRWKERVDSLEATAMPKSFIVYTRTDDGGWDAGRRVQEDCDSDGYYSLRLPISAGHIYSYKVVACNEGGESFPSEVLAVGLPEVSVERKVMIVNAFNRVSGPTWFDSADYAGFDNRSDSGVPWKRDWHFAGDQFEFHRSVGRGNTASNGFGASHGDFADRVIGGNTFDYVLVHGQSMVNAGYAFESSSSEAFEENAHDWVNGSSAEGKGLFALDVIYGKECTVRTAMESGLRGGVLSPGMQQAIGCAIANRCNIIISGAYIAKDIFSKIYPVERDCTAAQEFAKQRLGYSLQRAFGTRTGRVTSLDGSVGLIEFPVSPCEGSYCAESVDALCPLGAGSQIVLSYADTYLPAAIRSDFGSYKVAAFGFPLELISDPSHRDTLIRSALEFFTRGSGSLR